MTLTEAARLLEIAPDATPEQLEARFLDLRRKLEDKIANAPTPGLQAKYRTSLAQITEAFETLTLAADSSSLPVLQRAEPPAAAPSRPAPSAPVTPPAKKKSGNKEFIVVALIAIVVFGAGGWWVVKTRAEAAEKTRLEALAKLVAEEQAAAAKVAAEQEKIRLEALNASLRAAHADARTNWESLEREVQTSERAYAELKSEYRDARDKSVEIRAELAARVLRQKDLAKYFSEYLTSHRAKSLLAKLDAFIGARAYGDADTTLKELEEELMSAGMTVRESKSRAESIETPLDFRSTPPNLDWVVEWKFDGDNHATFSGKTPFIGDRFVGLGPATVTFKRPGWVDQVKQINVDPFEGTSAEAEFPGGKLKLSSQPSGLKWVVTDGSGRDLSGTTPAVLDDVAPGAATVAFKRDGFQDVGKRLTIIAGETASAEGQLQSQVLTIAVAEPEAEIWVKGKFLGRKEATFANQPPGKYPLELRHPKWPRYRTELVVKQENTAGTRRFSFAELAALTHTCDQCSGHGKLNHAERCTACNGTARIPCWDCEGKGTRYPNPATGYPPIPCTTCRRTGRIPCEAHGCDRGTYRATPYCPKCQGHGQLSELQLNQ